MAGEEILEFLPHGTQFLNPVTIQVHHHHQLSDDLALYTSEPDQPWAALPGATFTSDAARADVMHFSFFFTSPKPPSPVPQSDNGGAGGASAVGEASGGSAGKPAGAAGGPSVGAAGATGGSDSVGAGGEGGADDGAAGETNGPDAGAIEPPPDSDTPDAGTSSGSAGAPGAGGAPGTGGAPSTGGASTGGASTGGAAGSAGAGSGGAGGDPNSAVDYLDIGDWRGYLFSAADETSFVERTGMCAAGIVSSDPQFLSYAVWGWNLNQDLQTPSVEPWDPTLDAVHYDIASPVPMRLALRDVNGHDGCYSVPDPIRGRATFGVQQRLLGWQWRLLRRRHSLAVPLGGRAGQRQVGCGLSLLRQRAIS